MKTWIQTLFAVMLAAMLWGCQKNEGTGGTDTPAATDAAPAAPAEQSAAPATPAPEPAPAEPGGWVPPADSAAPAAPAEQQQAQ